MRHEMASVETKRNRFGLANIIGDSPQMTEIKHLVRRIAAGSSTSVLLLGESGSGKDMLARALHYESNRVEMPFMNITCTALPETLMESELFGYEKGAFTNAYAQKKGQFELANGGSVFLDEIGDMPPVLQAKLLRVLDDKSFKRVGGVEDIHVDVRVVAATNRNLEQQIEQGKFREDLFYRISTVPIAVPPLRERKGDIIVLAEYFFALYTEEFQRPLAPLSKKVKDKLLAYHWPGNVRELRNTIERAVLLCEGDRVTEADVRLGRIPRGSPGVPGMSFSLPPEGCQLDDVERSLIEQAMERARGNQAQAARLLGLTRDRLHYRLKKLRSS